MKKVVALTLAAFALLLIGYVLGKVARDHGTQVAINEEAQRALNLNSLSAYATYAEASELISQGNIDRAKCVADVAASIHYNHLRTCLANSECQRQVLDEVSSTAPELLQGGPTKFKLYESTQKCTSAAGTSK